jgi:hypothetical protein
MSATSRAHAARAGREHGVDLYLRPPGVSGWTAPSDDRRTEALVRAAHAHSCAKIAEWCRAASLEEAICRVRRREGERGGARSEPRRGKSEPRGGSSEPCGVDGNRRLARTEGDGERPSPPIGAAVPIGGAPEPNRGRGGETRRRRDPPARPLRRPAGDARGARRTRRRGSRNRRGVRRAPSVAVVGRRSRFTGG